MSLPILSTTAAVSGAAKSLVRNVSDGLGLALDFDAILRGETATDPESLRRASVDLIRDSLSAIGIEANPSLRIDVKSDGAFRLADHHPRGAEIEFQLSSNVEIREAIERLAAAVGETQLTIGPA